MMIIDHKKAVTLESPHFAAMRDDLNRYIGSALRAMDEKKMSSASIGLKIDIVTTHKTIQDENAPTGKREALVPDITYKIALTLQAKADNKGDVVRTGHELVKDDTGSYYILTTEEASGQLSMFNEWDELAKDGQKADEDETEESDDE